jgi:hypothetical protein
MITLKTILVVIGIFLLFVAGVWGYWARPVPADGKRWFGIMPGWFGLALLYLSQYVA